MKREREEKQLLMKLMSCDDGIDFSDSFSDSFDSFDKKRHNKTSHF